MSDEEEAKLILFGRNVLKMPCFRQSILSGLGGGIGTGLLVFLFTSRPKFAMNCTVGSYALITIGVWFNCRLKYEQNKRNMMETAYYIRQRNVWNASPNPLGDDVTKDEA